MIRGILCGVFILAVFGLVGMMSDATDRNERSQRVVAAPPATAAPEDVPEAVRAALPRGAVEVRREGGNWYSFKLAVGDGSPRRYLAAVWLGRGGETAWTVTRAD